MNLICATRKGVKKGFDKEIGAVRISGKNWTTEKPVKENTVTQIKENISEWISE